MCKKILIAAVFLVAVNRTDAGADPVGILDQSAWTSTSCPGCGLAIIATQSVAQTFTVGVNGLLTDINLGIYRSTALTTNDVIVNLLAAQNGLTTFDLSGSRATFAIPIADVPVCPEFCTSLPSVNVRLPVPLSVSANEEYALALSRPVGSTYPNWVIWTFAASAGEGVNYAGGQSYYHPEPALNWVSTDAQDHRFQTFVETTPEPAPILILAAGLLVVAATGHCLLRSSYSG